MDDEKPIDWGHLCSLRQAAGLVGVSTTTILRRVRDGEIAGAKIDGRWLIDRRTVPLGQGNHLIVYSPSAGSTTSTSWASTTSSGAHITYSTV